MLGSAVLKADPFRVVAPTIQGADISFCNLETALMEEGVALPKRHVIATPHENLDYLVKAGFQIVNVANNHVVDRGEAACETMIQSLKSKGLEIVGLQESGRAKPIVVSRNGVRIGFLGYADYGFRSGLMPIRERIALADVAELKDQVDCVVVSLHWGYEYVEFPSPEQQRLARRLVDAGAHMIIGHHPHVVQGIEEYRHGLIAYSLGNFQFRIQLADEFLSAGTGIVLRVQRSAQGRLRYTALPVRLSPSGEVELGRDGDPYFDLARLEALSAAVSGVRMKKVWWMREASRVWFPAQLESWFYKIKRFGLMQRLSMFRWLLRPTNLCYLLFYLAGAKHESSRALFRHHSP